MAQKAIELLKEVLARCGYPAAEIAKITGDDISDEVANPIKAIAVFTKDAALANPEIRNIIKAETLNGVDADVKRLMGVHGLPDEDQAEILKLDKTNLKIEKFLAKQKELTEKSAGATGKEKTILEKEIVELNGKFALERKSWEEKFSSQEAQRLNDKIEWAQENIYAGLNYATKDLPKEVNVTTAKTLINNYANTKGVKFTITDKGLALITKEGTPYFENNVSPTASEFITRGLHESKFLAVNDTEKQTNQLQQQQSQNPYYKKADTQNKTVNFSLIEKAEAELQQK